VDIEFAPELSEVKKESFFIVPNWLIDTNILCMLRPQAIVLYLLLIRRSFNGSGYIYTDQIVNATNIHRKHIHEYIKQLVQYKLITITNQSRSKGYKCYKINKRQDITDITTLQKNGGKDKTRH
jgi:predicted transcriptional regulator